MTCPSCGSEVEEGADLCLECGEPMGDSPAARIARAEASAPRPSTPAPPQPTPAPAPKPQAAPPKPQAAPPKPQAAPPKPQAAPPKPARKWANLEEPEPKRCPGCGMKSFAPRCPSCGTRLHTDED